MKSEIVLETEAMIEGQLCESGDVIATIDSPFEFSTVAGLVSVFRAKRVIVDVGEPDPVPEDVEPQDEDPETPDKEILGEPDEPVADLAEVEIDYSELIAAGLSEKLAARLVRNGIHTVDAAIDRYNELDGDLSKLDGIGAGYAKQIADVLFVDGIGDKIDEQLDEETEEELDE